MANEAQIIISYDKKRRIAHFRAGGFKLGEERLIIHLLKLCADYFKSDRFKKTIVDTVIKQTKENERKDIAPIIRRHHKWPHHQL